MSQILAEWYLLHLIVAIFFKSMELLLLMHFTAFEVYFANLVTIWMCNLTPIVKFENNKVKGEARKVAPGLFR